MSFIKQKPIFLILIMAVLALTLFFIFRTTDADYTDYNTNTFSASVAVTELNKDRTHEFIIFSDGERTILDGYFVIENKKYQGKILYDGNNSYLFRSDPDQAVVYSEKNQLIYGFLPVSSALQNDSNANITILEKEKNGLPIFK